MLRVVSIMLLLINLVACSSTSEWKANYGNAEQSISSSSLDVPPDLSKPISNESLSIPNIASSGASYSSYTSEDQTGVTVLSASSQQIKQVRDGKDMWLEIQMSADKLWPELKIFFIDLGFKIEREDKKLGVMETDWFETKPYVPSNWVNKMLNRIVATGLKDKYRIRVEKTTNASTTRLFFSHQGQQELATDDSQGGTFVKYWVRRDSDPELEAEMYQRFLIFKDTDKGTAKKLTENIQSKERTVILEKKGSKVLQVGEGFARTWRRVGIALDRIGLLVDDRNRSGGLYYLRITDDFQEKVKEDKGWLASLFSSDKVKLKERYLLSVNEEKDSSGKPATIISLYETTGAKADSRFVTKLLTDLKSYLD